MAKLARIGSDDFAVPETVGLNLDEGKQLTAAIQAEIVRCQAAVMGELSKATVVLDWFHVAMRFEHALRAAVGVGADIVDAYVGNIVHRDVEHAKWRPWHGRWRGCLIRLIGVYRWTKAKSTAKIEGVQALRHHLRDLIAYLEADRSGLVNYGARDLRHELVSIGFVESSINEIIALRAAAGK